MQQILDWPLGPTQISNHLAALSPSNIIKGVSGLESFPLKPNGHSSSVSQLPPKMHGFPPASPWLPPWLPPYLCKRIFCLSARACTDMVHDTWHDAFCFQLAIDPLSKTLATAGSAPTFALQRPLAWARLSPQVPLYSFKRAPSFWISVATRFRKPRHKPSTS